MNIYLSQANLVCSVGDSLDDTWNNLKNGKLGIVKIADKNIADSSFNVRVGAPYKLDSLPDLFKNEIHAEYELVISKLISQLNPTKDLNEIDGIILGSNVNKVEKYLSQTEISEDTCIELIKKKLVMKGFTLDSSVSCISIYNTCITGLSVVKIAKDLIVSKKCKNVLVLTVEPRLRLWSLLPLNFLNMLTREEDLNNASVSFSHHRSGFVKGDGAAVAIFSSVPVKKAVKLLAVNECNDIYRLTDPDENGSGLMMAMNKSILEAKINVKDIDLIQAHAPSTKKYDSIEASVIKKIFMNHANPAISALKSQIGHTNISSGLIALLIAAKSLEDQILLPICNFKQDPSIEDLNFVTTLTNARLNVAMINASGIGGHNASAIISL